MKHCLLGHSRPHSSDLQSQSPPIPESSCSFFELRLGLAHSHSLVRMRTKFIPESSTGPCLGRVVRVSSSSSESTMCSSETSTGTRKGTMNREAMKLCTSRTTGFEALVIGEQTVEETAESTISLYVFRPLFFAGCRPNRTFARRVQKSDSGVPSVAR